MAVGFGTVTFGVISLDGVLPVPVRADDTGFFHYEATIRVDSRADMLTLQNYFSIVTEQPAIGALDIGTIVVEKGDGVRTLTYPEGTGEHALDAILISFQPRARVLLTDPYLADCIWWTEQPA